MEEIKSHPTFCSLQTQDTIVGTKVFKKKKDWREMHISMFPRNFAIPKLLQGNTKLLEGTHQVSWWNAEVLQVNAKALKCSFSSCYICTITTPL